MRIVLAVAATVFLAGCKANIDFDAPRQYACALDGGAVVKSGDADPQCPTGMRCGLEGVCHDDKPIAYSCSPADGGYVDDYCEGGWRCGLERLCHPPVGGPFLCDGNDTWCGDDWRCGPDNVCVSTEHDALLPRTGADVTSTALYPLGTIPNANGFAVSPYVLRQANCGFLIGRSATVVANGTVYRAAMAQPLLQTDGGVCSPPAELPSTSYPLNVPNFQLTAVADVGTLAVVGGKSNGVPIFCPAAWLLGTNVASANCIPVPYAIDGIRASQGANFEFRQPNGDSTFLNVGSRYVVMNSDWKLVPGELLGVRKAEVYLVDAGFIRPSPEPLVDVALMAEQLNADGGTQDYVVAIDDAGTLFGALLNGDLRFSNPVPYIPSDGGSPFWPINPTIDQQNGNCFLEQGMRPKMIRFHQRDGKQAFFVGYDNPFTGAPGHEAVIRAFELERGPSLPPRACLPLPGGAFELGSSRVFLSQDIYRLCRDAQLVDFVVDSDQNGARGVRAWCRADGTGKLQYEVLTTATNQPGGGNSISTQKGEYAIPAVPYFQRPLTFSRSHAGVWAQMDDQGRIWASSAERADQVPEPILDAFHPDRPPTVVLNKLQTPLMFGEEIALGPVKVSNVQGWRPTAQGQWTFLPFGEAGLKPMAPVRNQPMWAVSRITEANLPTPIFVFDFGSLLSGGPSEERGVRVPARIADETLLRAPYTGLQTTTADGGSLLLLTVDDTLATLDVTDVVNNLDAGYVFSASEIVNIPAAEVRMTPVSRGGITSLTTVPNDGVNFASGYLVAGGRPFRFTAPNANVWRSTELEVGTNQPVAVVTQGGRVRLVFKDGAVVGLPSRTSLAPGLPAAGGNVRQAISACGEVLAVAEHGLFFLADGVWKPVSTTARFAASPQPTLFVLEDGVVLVDSDGAVHRVTPPGGCP